MTWTFEIITHSHTCAHVNWHAVAFMYIPTCTGKIHIKNGFVINKMIMNDNCVALFCGIKMVKSGSLIINSGIEFGVNEWWLDPLDTHSIVV